MDATRADDSPHARTGASVSVRNGRTEEARGFIQKDDFGVVDDSKLPPYPCSSLRRRFVRLQGHMDEDEVKHRARKKCANRKEY